MRYRLLGNSGLRVSEAALGTMTFGEEWGWGSAKDEARKMYDAFRGAGGNFIDTANFYTNGTSESFLGEFMKDHRQSVVLATKYSNAAPGTDPNAAGNHRKSMVQALEASLDRLRTDYIDLYWVHIWDQITPVEEVTRGLDDLVRQGKVLYVGISDAPAWWIAQANMLAQLRGWSPFIGLQVEYSLIERTVERELVPVAKALNIGFTPWSLRSKRCPIRLAAAWRKSRWRGVATARCRSSPSSVRESFPNYRIILRAWSCRSPGSKCRHSTRRAKSISDSHITFTPKSSSARLRTVARETKSWHKCILTSLVRFS
jgi:aryl-alcohol dehydrogenase-like predicted oxidoreductase